MEHWSNELYMHEIESIYKKFKESFANFNIEMDV